jgi:lipoyl(octanoyl) transferase
MLEAMRTFVDTRTQDTPDELWILEHPPVYTLGQACQPEHLPRFNINHNDNTPPIDIIQTDRGGQITYHGPGQMVIYCLLDLKRQHLAIRPLIWALEKAVQDLLADYGLHSHVVPGAPGIYIDQAKICALGLRVRRGYTYHGLALNYNMDLAPFLSINPCGYRDLKMTQLSAHLDPLPTIDCVQIDLVTHLAKHLRYNCIQYHPISHQTEN